MSRCFILAAGFALGASPAVAQTTGTVSPFQRAKAEALLEQKLACLGCHTLNGQGGRIGPDLGSVGARLDAAAIRRQIVQPRALMPRIPLTPGTLDLLVAYLAEQKGAASTHPLIPSTPTTTSGGAAIYEQRCAACHGTQGKGDGPNAAYLDRPPARHADASQMRTRTDDRLFDAIFAGGAIMGGSARMPAFGETLTTAEIQSLVKYIRQLCHCQQPAWADAAR